jgi:hypothetical protein
MRLHGMPRKRRTVPESFDALVQSLAKKHSKDYYAQLEKCADDDKTSYERDDLDLRKPLVSKIMHEYITWNDFYSHYIDGHEVDYDIFKIYREVDLPFSGKIEYGTMTLYDCHETIDPKVRLKNSTTYLFIQYYDETHKGRLPAVIRVLFDYKKVEEVYVRHGFRKAYEDMQIDGMAMPDGLEGFLSSLYDINKHIVKKKDR